MRVEKYPIRIIEGNSFTLSIELQQIAWGHGTGTTSEFVPLESDRIRVWLVSKSSERIEAFNAVISANELLISFDEGICKGLYDIEIFVYRANGTRLHCRLEKRIHIVPTTDKMGIEADTIKLTGAVLLVIDGVSLQWDDTPTEGSGAVVTSDGIYHALQELREDFDNAKIEVDEELNGTSANPVQNKAVTEAIEGIEDDLQILQSNSVNVEVDAQTREFAIMNANGVKIGTIKVGTGINGVATLAFKDKAGNEINVTLPNLAYNENTQYLEYIDASGAHHNTIRLSNLQIKGVFAETPSMGDWALGDLILVGANSSYELNVFDGTNWQSLGSINDVSLQADQVEFDNSTNGFTANNVQRAIEEVSANLEGIEKDYSLTDDDDSIEIEDEQGNKVVEITPNGVDAKNLKSNGKNVATEDELDLLATKEEVEGKQDEIEDIEQTEEAIQIPIIEFRDDENGYVGEVSPQAIAAKKFLIKTSPSDAGTDITDIAGSTSIAKTFGLSDVIHVIGFGQSMMAGSNSGEPVTTTQSRNNLWRFIGGVRPYDVLDLDTNGRVNIERQNGKVPTYLEMSDKKEEILAEKDVEHIDDALASLVPLTEQRVKYKQNQDDTYSPDVNGTIFQVRHQDAETPLSGFCEGLLNALEKAHGSNFGFDIIASCCAYGSADFISLCPLDRDGKIHNVNTPSDGTNMNYFEVLLMSVKGAKAIADAAGKSYSVDVVVYMESNTITGTGVNLTAPLKAYRTAQLFTLVNQRVKEITKQSNDIIFVCDQTKNAMTQREALRILGVEKEIVLTTDEQNILNGLSNLDVEPYDLNKIFLVTSANNYKVGGSFTGADRVHHPAIVHKQKGATLGEAYAKIMTGRGFEPLYPINVKVIGNDIYVKYHVPISPIVIDTDAVNGNNTYTNYMNGRGVYGFGLFDRDNGIRYKFTLDGEYSVNENDKYEYQVTADSKKTYTVKNSYVDNGNTVVIMSGSSQYDTFTSSVGGTTLTKNRGSGDDTLTFTDVSEESYVADVISAVEVSEPDTIKISCQSSPAGYNLEYCYKPMPNTGTGTTGPTNSEFGNIRDSQGDVSKINIGGTDYPLHNWSIGFSKEL